MPSLVSTEEISSFTGDYQNLFDTFKRQFVVVKEPKKKISSADINADFLYYGYQNVSQKPNTLANYEIISGIYSGMIKYGDSNNRYTSFTEFKNVIPESKVRLKVEEDAKNFITKDKTERIVVDGLSFKVMGSFVVKYFFGVKLYVFNLEELV